MSESPQHAAPPRNRRALLLGAVVTALVLLVAATALVAVRLTAGTAPEAGGPDGSTSGPTRTVTPTSSPTSTPTPTPTPTPPPVEPAPPPEPPPPPPPAPVCADDVLVCVNLARVSNGLGELAADGTLNAAAQQCADRMAASGQLTHSASGPGGYSAWGENIAVGYPSAAAVFEGWMNSPGHRGNILNPVYTAMGIGYAPGNWWCQQFGG